MKIGHVVLFTVAASVLTYLNTVLKSEDEKEDKTLEDLEEFADEESRKLLMDNQEEIEESDLENDLEDISDSLREFGRELLDGILTQNDEPIDIHSDIESVMAEQNTDSKEDIINDIERLLASLDEDESVAQSEDYQELEDDYFAKIKEAIDSTLVSDENGEAVDMAQALSDDEKVEDDDIDSIFQEILRQEKANDEKIEESENIEDEYLDSLADELEKALKEDEVQDEKKDVYAMINELYPYLSLNFVRAVYDLKEEIAFEYPLDEKLVLLHRISFENIEDLRQFTEIVLDHDYRVNVDENKMIVDVFKWFKNEDGKILTNIFEIANQARLLNGSYEGYHVELI